MQTIDAAQQNLTNLKTHFNTANTSASLLVGSEFTANTNLTTTTPAMLPNQSHLMPFSSAMAFSHTYTVGGMASTLAQDNNPASTCKK
jgi:hypothetical protein